MKAFFILFFVILLTFSILDAVWLSVMAKRFYDVHIGHLIAVKANFIPVVLFYLLYALALTVFIGVPALNNHYSYLTLFLLGLLFGLTAYGTYDLTNQAIMKNWPTIVTIVDMSWGGFITGITSVIAVSITKYFIG